ncbi:MULTISPECIES: glycosyltransferase [Clostridium]|uniref:glycosyltransferase n=1 Tax=Clostridium TaxID=1485 RepID=UPI000825F28B|nr:MULTISPECIES: glycosyltransferase [Clostridium]PJI06707.1 glycosyl transferase [Clostridium sp. CT7]
MKLKKIRNHFLIISSTLMTIIYLIWRIFFTIPIGDNIVSIFSALALLIVEILGMFEAAVHYYQMSEISYPSKPKVNENLFPDIDIFIATYNEPKKLLYKTINGCINMDYPDKTKVHIYLCDDGNRPEFKNLAHSMKINYLTRSDRKGSKAGNLNNALAHSTSPLIVTFDADMIPMHDFLTASVPYFLTSEKVGFVQTPQSFYNPDLFQYYLYSEGRIPNEQDYFYRDVQISRNKSNSVIYGGTNTVISRKALEDAGGFYTKAITEDFATGLIIQSKGYKCYAINEIHASGLAPEDLPSLIKQRERWSRGCIQTGRKLNILFRKGLTIGQKLSYISAISYWYSGIKRLIYIMSPILFSVFGVIVVKCTLTQVLIFWLPMYLLSNAALKKLSNNIRTTKWTNIYETILFPSLIIPVLLETLGISQVKFAVTRKDGVHDDKNYRLKRSVPHIFFAVLSLIGIINCTKMIFDSGSPTYIVVLFWLVVNFYNLLMSIFFMLGRKSFRTSERFLAKEKCIISYYENQISSTTIDISEGGLAVILNFPEFIPYDIDVKLSIHTEIYNCEFKAVVVHVQNTGRSWKYAFKITTLDERNHKKLLQIIYDRVHSLPKSLDKSNSIFDDIRVNVLDRNKKPFQFNRKLPRIELNTELLSDESGEVTMTSFNYEYIVLKEICSKRLSSRLTLHISYNKRINCIFEKNINYKRKEKFHSYLYRIEDYKALQKDEEFRQILNQWIINNKEVQYQALNKNRNDDYLNEMDYL